MKFLITLTSLLMFTQIEAHATEKNSEFFVSNGKPYVKVYGKTAVDIFTAIKSDSKFIQDRVAYRTAGGSSGVECMVTIDKVKNKPLNSGSECSINISIINQKDTN